MKPPPESEAVFQASIVDLAHLFGWKGYHTYDSRRSQKGFPDYVFAHEEKGALLVVEFKSQKGRLSPEQIMWGAIFQAIARVNILVFYEVWRPSDRPEIELFFKTIGK